MGPTPAIYSNILTFGRKTRPEEELLTAKIGGVWRTPNYALSYLLAARYAITTAAADGDVDVVAMPAVYLQRHAFELALKRMIDIAYDIKAKNDWIEALKNNPVANCPAPSKVEKQHRLTTILGLLNNALQNIDYKPVHADISNMVEKLENVEKLKDPEMLKDPEEWDHTRLRYPTTANGEQSLPSSHKFAVGRTQKELEDLFERFFIYLPTYHDEPGKDNNLMTELVEHQEANFQQLLSLVPIDRI